MKFDERIFYMSKSGDAKDMKAAGVRMNNVNNDLVGIYMFWDEYDNPSDFLSNVVRDFGEAKLYGNKIGVTPSLICKMRTAEQQYLLKKEEPLYQQLRMDLLEIRASNPKPFLALNYDDKKDLWIPTTKPSFASIDSNYSQLPPDEEKRYA